MPDEVARLHARHLEYRPASLPDRSTRETGSEPSAAPAVAQALGFGAYGWLGHQVLLAPVVWKALVRKDDRRPWERCAGTPAPGSAAISE